MSQANPPAVLCFSGNDPTGGAGLQADIEALAGVGCHAAPVVTALTVQDTHNVRHFEAVSSSLVQAQAQAVLEDMPIRCFKLGMLGSVENVEVIHALIRAHPHIPVVLDPILKAGGGGELAGGALREAMRELLFPLTTVLTPNSEEARSLAPQASTLDACAEALLAQGCRLVLITGTHENSTTVDNHLYAAHRLRETFSWQRLDGCYHGSGCTLAASIAGLLARGLEPFDAIHKAQEYTWRALKAGYRVGTGQHLPNRLFREAMNEPIVGGSGRVEVKM